MQLSGAREAELIEAANLLLNARRTRTPMDDLPSVLQPQSTDEAYFIQDALAASHGGVGGWKVSASGPAGLTLAPLPAAWIAPGGSVLSGVFRLFGVEAELAFLLGRSLPASSSAYTREQVAAAIVSCHPAIEVVESGLLDPSQATDITKLADLQLTGGVVYGPGYPGWRQLDLAAERVSIAVGGMVRVDKTGPNAGADPLELLVRLANEGARRTGGLEAGQWIITGSWTGCTTANEGSTVDVRFASLGRVTMQFA